MKKRGVILANGRWVELPASEPSPTRNQQKARWGERKKKVRLQLLAQSQICHYCHRPLTEDNSCVDHIVPLGKGGTNDRANLVICCIQCNHAKQDLPYAAFFSMKKHLRAFYDKKRQIEQDEQATNP